MHRAYLSKDAEYTLQRPRLEAEILAVLSESANFTSSIFQGFQGKGG